MRTVFMEKGFAAASLDELAAASGLNRPSLYAAFGDKEQLYIATLRFYGTRSIEGLEAILGGPGTIEQRLGKVYKAAIDLYTAPPHRPGCMIVGTAAVESPSHPKIAAVANELLAAIEKSLERGFADERSGEEALARRPRAHGRRHPVRHRHPRPARRQGRRPQSLRRLDGAGHLRMKM